MRQFEMRGVAAMIATAAAAFGAAGCAADGARELASAESVYFQGDPSGFERYREAATIMDDLDTLSAEAPAATGSRPQRRP